MVRGGVMSTLEVTSADGTKLNCRASGDGPPMVLVHGALGSKETFAIVEPLLSTHHQVVTFDRRGRGESGDGPNYSIDRETDDIVAVVTSLGKPVHLVAHSFGATCSILAAERGVMSLASLSLYEPPSLRETDPSAWEQAVAHVANGEYEAALRSFAPLAGVSDAEVESLVAIPPVWARLCNAMPRLGRELDALHTCDVFTRPGPFDASVPTLHIKGSETTGDSYVNTQTIARLFPKTRETTMQGQGHSAPGTGPEAHRGLHAGLRRLGPRGPEAHQAPGPGHRGLINPCGLGPATPATALTKLYTDTRRQ